MTASNSSPQRLSGGTVPGFRTTLASEWSKLRSVRSTWIIVGLAIVLSIGFSALMAFIQGFTFEDWSEAERLTFDPLLNSTIGILFTLVLLIVLGVVAVTSEYGSRMIRTTFIVTPNRTRVVAAKATVIAILGFLVAAITTPGMIYVSQVIFDSYELPTVSMTDSDTTRLIVTYSLLAGLIYTLIPFAIAFLLRGTASAITASLGLFMLPWMLAPLLPMWVQENIIRYMPDVALDSLAGVTSETSMMYIDQGLAAFVIIVWIAGALVLAAITVNRRDA
jgi:ABC-2 type transport system permease protein